MVMVMAAVVMVVMMMTTVFSWWRRRNPAAPLDPWSGHRFVSVRSRDQGLLASGFVRTRLPQLNS